jgi:two-component system, OmpR family, phosphate regulon response regulator PhoB
MTANSPMTVLVVEDDPGLRALYRAALQVEGFPVVAVEDGVDALRYIETTRPAAVVLDMQLPRLAGRDVHREIAGRADTRNIPIIVVTGGDIDDLNPSEFACILRKPFDAESLVNAVRDCLAKARA